jgi:hypothetical protein
LKPKRETRNHDNHNEAIQSFDRVIKLKPDDDIGDYAPSARIENPSPIHDLSAYQRIYGMNPETIQGFFDATMKVGMEWLRVFQQTENATTKHANASRQVKRKVKKGAGKASRKIGTKQSR